MTKQGKHSTEWTMTNQQKMIYDIASGLSYLHSKSTYILQLNPKNVRVDSKYEVKLSDIGNFIQSDKTKMTSTKFNCSLFYLSPEQLTNLKEFDDKSDVYSFSLIVYEIITNKPAFPFKTPSDLISKIIREYYRPSLNGIPLFYQSLLQRCLSSDPEEGPSFEQIIQELENSKELISPDVDNEEYLRYQKFLKQT